MVCLICYYLGEIKAGMDTQICVGLDHPWGDEKLLAVIALRLGRVGMKGTLGLIGSSPSYAYLISFHFLFLTLCKYILQNKTLRILQSRAIIITRYQK